MAQYILQLQTDKEVPSSAIGNKATIVLGGVTYNFTVVGVSSVADPVIVGTKALSGGSLTFA